MFWKAKRTRPETEECDASVESLVEHELGLAHASIRRGRQNRIVDPPEDFVGLALSGGGIRSATFNLGLLQGLHEVGLLGRLDYLSTVSGGGYVGSFWSAWRSRREFDGRVFPEPGPEEVEAPEVRHLREFGRFLAPRMGVLSWDTGRMLVAVTSSLVPSLLTALSVIALVMIVWSTVLSLLLGSTQVVSVLVLATVLGGLFLAAEWLYTERREPLMISAYLVGCVTALVLASGGWWLLTGSSPDAAASPAGTAAAVATGSRGIPVLGPSAEAIDWPVLFLPSLVLLGVAAVFSLRRWFTSRFERSRYREIRRAAFDRVHGQLLLASVSSAIMSGLWILGAVAHEIVRGSLIGGGTLAAATGGSVWSFAYVHRKLNDPLVRTVRGKLLERLAPVLPRVLAYVALALLVVSTVAALIAVQGRLSASPGILGSWPLSVLVLACSIIVLGALYLMDPNEVGFHAFYKGRIARAFIGASNAAGREKRRGGDDRNGADPGRPGDHRRQTEEQPGDDVLFARVPTPTGRWASDDQDVMTTRRPVHLVCCAANDLSADPVATLDRGAVSAVLSHAGFSVDAEWNPWANQIGAPTLAHAVTASGAAFNSLMGGYSVRFGPAAIFLMTALNLRLGLWLPHPTRATVHRRERWRAFRLMVGLPFFREMAGLARADGPDVHLSDGGHFENLAVYELIRRRCRFVIASDSSADPTVSFNDFGNLVRRVREDFGVDIRIDLEPLRPDPRTGMARQSMVAGDIHYPEGDTGVLLYIKPSITGTEPADIAQYHAKNSVFPHESTVDQFFDEAQWESYRRLGQHIASTAFNPLTTGLDAADPDYAGRLIGRARREWQPRPSGFDTRLAHFTNRVVQLDTMLRESGCEALLEQVYPELAMAGTPSEPANEAFSENGARGAGGHPTGPALAATLHTIRFALMTLNEVFESERLDLSYNHPLNLGVMNYYARWTNAPLIQLWWPLLKALHPQPFTRFLEERFGLAGWAVATDDRTGPTVEITESVGGFAWDCWKRQKHVVGDGRRVISYILHLHGSAGESHVDVQAAQVVATYENGVLTWDSEDFFVPPGLWGIGIGEDFLRRLSRGDLPFEGIRRLCVRIRMATDGSAAAKRAAANQVQLYRAAGFIEVGMTGAPENVGLPLEHLPPVEDEPQRLGRWMVRDVGLKISVPLQSAEGLAADHLGQPRQA